MAFFELSYEEIIILLQENNRQMFEKNKQLQEITKQLQIDLSEKSKPRETGAHPSKYPGAVKEIESSLDKLVTVDRVHLP